jgi:hypothetical protein
MPDRISCKQRWLSAPNGGAGCVLRLPRTNKTLPLPPALYWILTGCRRLEFHKSWQRDRNGRPRGRVQRGFCDAAREAARAGLNPVTA